MTRRAIILGTLLLSLPAGAADPPPEPVDVLALADARPVVVRLAVTVDGRPLDHGWVAFGDALFKHLDKDKSGSLDGAEPARLPPLLALLTDRSGFPPPGASLSRAALADYLRANDLAPFRVSRPANAPPRQGGRLVRVPVGTPAELDAVFLKVLDADRDAKLSAADLASAPTALARLDADENELLTASEILGRSNESQYVLEGDREPQSNPFALVRLGRKADPALARALLDRYRPKDGPARRLTRAAGLPDAAFVALDRDGDGELDAEELARFGGACSPDVELAFHLGTPQPGKRAVVTAAGRGAVGTAAAPTGDFVAVTLPGLRLEFTPRPSNRTDFPLTYESLFRQLDRDANGYLDATEARSYPTFRDGFPFLDADGDGKVFEAELTAAAGAVEPLARAAAGGMVAADVSETSRGLFGLFDADGDGRLSPRELRGLTKLPERLGVKDGLLTPGDVPRRFEVTLAATPSQPSRASDTSAVARPAAGPVWFRKMDRNRDGDVSRREFLGTAADFRRLDRDGDGLIDPHEAAAAPPN